jgi:hypothetical protein
MAKKKVNKSKGLGDVIENITEVTGVKALVGDCVGCNERKERLNRKYPNLKNAREFTEDELDYWRNFIEVRTAKIERNTLLEICKIYSDVLSLKYWQPSCFSCGGTIRSVSNMIDKLDLIYKNQTNENTI